MIQATPWDGQKITAPGVYSGVPIEAYHGDICDGPSISSSGLRTIFYESPAHYYVDSYLNPEREEKPTSQAFLFGRAAHHLLLGEAGFRQRFIVRPETYGPDDKPWNGNANICKDWLADAAGKGLIVLTPNDIKMIRGMAKSLSQEPLIQSGILNGLIEHSFFWKDPETGIWLKWRPDAVPTDDMDFSDLKTTVSVEDEALERSVGDYGYCAQGALGAEACNTVLGRPMESFSLVFVEKTPPHCVRVKTVKPVDIEMGLEQNRAALRLFARALETGKWLGPSGEQGDAEFIGLSPRAASRCQYRIDQINRMLEL